MKSVLFLMSMLLLPIGAFAGGWQGSTHVVQVLYEGEDDGNRVYVVFTSTSNPDACPNGGAGYNRVYGATQKGKNILATLLMAFSVGKTVIPNIVGCDDWGRAIVSGLIVTE